MKKEYKVIFKAPWSCQKVSSLGRIFSLFILIGVIFVFGATAYYAVKDGVNKEQIWFVLVVLFGGIYFILFLMHIVIKGKAPLGWLPRW